MLRTKDYYAQIEQLHNEGKNAKEISRILNFKYHQPVYNYFKKRRWKTLNRKAYPRPMYWVLYVLMEVLILKTILFLFIFKILIMNY